MGYTYDIVTLESIDETGANIRPVKSYVPVVPARTSVSMGEKMRLVLQIGHTPQAYKPGQKFCLNLKMFSSPTDVRGLIPRGFGWKISVSGAAGGLSANWAIFGGAADRNFEINSITFSGGNKKMDIEMDFFVTADLHDWAVKQFINNNKRFLRNSVNATFELHNSVPSAFDRIDSYLEIAFFECDDQLQPFSILAPSPQDPIARDAAATQYETFAINLSCKWYDENEGATNDWISTTDKKDNFLKSINIDAGLYTGITDVQHKGYAFYYKNTLPNFIFDAETTRMVINKPGDAVGDKNNVTIVIDTPNIGTFSTLIMYLIRTDKENDSIDFANSYLLDAATIPKAQPAVATINGGVFETPSAWGTAGGLTTIDFIMNGEFLEPGAEYNLIGILYDNVTDFSSVHISPKLAAPLAQIFQPTITGIISTYKQDHTNVNDLSVTNFERVKLRIEVDAATYSSLADFQAELQSVKFTSEFGSFIAASNTDFQYFLANGTTQGIGLQEINVIDLGGGVYAFEATIRSYFAVAATLSSTHTWELNFAPLGANQPDDFVIRFEQRLKHRKDDLTRLNGMRVLDYDVFPGSLVEKQYICTTDDRVVIETEKNGAPDANVIAMVLGINPADTIPIAANNQLVEEEENYVGNLPQLSSVVIEDVDPAFSSQLDPDKAYWVLVVDGFSQTGTFYVETLIYDI